MTNITDAPDLTYGFVLSTRCDDETLSRELTAGRLVHHSTLGDIETQSMPPIRQMISPSSEDL
jgi:hypothetical protein